MTETLEQVVDFSTYSQCKSALAGGLDQVIFRSPFSLLAVCEIIYKAITTQSGVRQKKEETCWLLAVTSVKGFTN